MIFISTEQEMKHNCKIVQTNAVEGMKPHIKVATYRISWRTKNMLLTIICIILNIISIKKLILICLEF